MAKSEYTVDELSSKIETTKAELKEMKELLRRYEEELERKKQETPWGVPLEDMALATVFDTYKFGFTSDTSRFIFSARLNEYVKLLQKCAKNEPIEIKILLPLLGKGYVAMDKNSDWYWYSERPKQGLVEWTTEKPAAYLVMFNLKPADNWETSLQECGL